MTLHACRAFRDSLEAYSLDALDDVERDQVEAHLRHCHDCTAEAAALSQLAASLAGVVPQVSPPPRLRKRVLAAAEPPRPVLALLPSAWRPYLAGAAALVAVGSLAWAVSLQGQLNAQQAALERLSTRAERYDRVVAVLSSPSMVVANLSGDAPAPTAQGRVVADPRAQSGMLMVWNLPPVPGDQAYQVWFVSETGRVSGGLVRPGEAGSGYFFLQVPPDLSSYRAIGLTVEPAQGSPGPTGPRVLAGSL